MKWLILLQHWYCIMQLPIVMALLVEWFVTTLSVPAFRTVSIVFVQTVIPLAEIAMLLAVVGILLGSCVILIAGPYTSRWSKLSPSSATLAEGILVCTPLITTLFPCPLSDVVKTTLRMLVAGCWQRCSHTYLNRFAHISL
jgi:hypothetical protein